MFENRYLLCAPVIAGLLPAPQPAPSRKSESSIRIAAAIEILIFSAARWIDGELDEDALIEVEFQLHIALMQARNTPVSSVFMSNAAHKTTQEIFV